MAHRRIVLCDLDEFLLRFLVPERMQKRDTAFEWLLHDRSARYREVHRPQLRSRQIFVVMVFIRQRQNSNDSE